MDNRETELGILGIAIGSAQGTRAVTGSNTDFSFSAYSDYTPVTVRSYTTRTDHAGVERDKSRDR